MAPLVKKNWHLILLFSVLGLTGTLVGLFSSLISRDLVDMITGHQTAALLRTFVLLVATTIFTTVISQISQIITAKINLTMQNKIQYDLFEKILESKWEYLSSLHSADLMRRWNGDSSAIATNVLTLIPNIINYSFKLISSFYIVVKNDYTFAIIALLCLPISFLSSRLSLRKMKNANMETYATGTKLSAFNQDVFGNIQTVKALDMMSLLKHQLKDLQKENLDSSVKYQKSSAINALLLTLVSLFTTYTVYGWGIYRVWSGAISYGTMTLFISLTGSLSASISSFVQLMPTIVRLSNSIHRYRALSELPKEDFSMMEEVKDFFDTHKDTGIGLSVRDVCYSYPNGTEVFTGASFEAHPHEIISLVGPSGEGKTTMLRFLLSIINATDGQGYICAGNSTPDNSALHLPLTASVRQLIAYVPQGNTMLSGTIAANMRNVCPDASDEEIVAALKLACAWDFVEKLPEGINTPLLERGGGFSEGQAQRLSIARALLRKSPILLLDEATSALDIETEKKVLGNILSDAYPRTTIVTTHRPSVLKQCERVYSIKDKGCKLMSSDEIKELLTSF